VATSRTGRAGACPLEPAALALPYMLRIAASVGNEMEAAMVCGRLADAGIHCMQQRAGVGGRSWGPGGPRDVYVDERDLARARAVLSESVSEQELIREEEQADPVTPTGESTPAELSSQGGDLPPKSHRLLNALKRILRADSDSNAPENPFGS
jgi:putative signal transducing protein